MFYRNEKTRDSFSGCTVQQIDFYLMTFGVKKNFA